MNHTDQEVDKIKTAEVEPATTVVNHGETSMTEQERLQQECKALEAKYLYLYAEFDNFKKRTIKERSDLIKFGWENVARDLLEILDNLQLSITHMPSTIDKNLASGIRMVANHFESTLQKQGVTKIEAIDKNFDPNLHEAVGQEVSDKAPGVVTKEQSSGFLLHGRLLRPARVIISQGNK